MKIRINILAIKNILKNIILLIPFFELQSFSMLAESGVKSLFFNTLLQIYSLSRLIITMIIFIYIYKKNKLRISYIVTFTIVFIILENIVSFANRSLYFNYLIGSITFIGFAILCSYMIYTSQSQFISSCKSLFGILSFIGALQIIIMPFGFLNVTEKAFAIYFLGSKNSSFFYFILYLFFAFYSDIQKYNKILFRHILAEIMFIVASIYADSINTMVMLIIVLLFSIIFNYYKKICKLISPGNILFLVLIFAIIILVPEIREKLENILNFFGRNTSFTGRDVLWEQAIECFLKEPICGTGILTQFRLKTGVLQDNAHSQFLDLLAKYGVIVFIVYISIPVSVLYRTLKYNKYSKHFIALKSIIVFVILFHSIVDHMPFYHFILIMAAVELLGALSYDRNQEKNIISFRRIYYG